MSSPEFVRVCYNRDSGITLSMVGGGKHLKWELSRDAFFVLLGSACETAREIANRERVHLVAVEPPCDVEPTRA